mgnify:FL=1
MFQDPGSSFNPLMTIAENVAEPLLVHHKYGSVAEAKNYVGDLLEMVQLPRAYMNRFPHELSGGQRQRASLARGLALKPSLLIADEPTSALDVSVQAKVLELFKRLQVEIGFACLFITHDLAVVDMLADRIMVMHKARSWSTAMPTRLCSTRRTRTPRSCWPPCPCPTRANSSSTAPTSTSS